jgi:hypothetical protein
MEWWHIYIILHPIKCRQQSERLKPSVHVTSAFHITNCRWFASQRRRTRSPIACLDARCGLPTDCDWATVNTDRMVCSAHLSTSCWFLPARQSFRSSGQSASHGWVLLSIVLPMWWPLGSQRLGAVGGVYWAPGDCRHSRSACCNSSADGPTRC